MNHEPGPSTTQSASRTASTAWGQGTGVGGLEGDGQDRAVAGGHLDLAAHGRHGLRGGRVGATDLRRHHQGRERHRQDPAGGAEEASDPVEGRDVVAELLPQGDDQQVADHVSPHVAVPGEPVLEDLGPGLAPLVVAAQSGEGHPQVTGWQHSELLAQPARRATVVGHRHDGGQPVGHPAQRRQGRVQPVAST